MPTSILRELLLLMPVETIEREVTRAGGLEPNIVKLSGVDVQKFKRDVQSSVIHSPQLRRDCNLWFILLNLLHDDEYLQRLMEHEPEPRKSLFLEECIKICHTLATNGSLGCVGIFPQQLHTQIFARQLTPTVAVEYLTLVYARL
jgi:hypothetical protein